MAECATTPPVASDYSAEMMNAILGFILFVLGAFLRTYVTWPHD
jgi:hypothetical protein